MKQPSSHLFQAPRAEGQNEVSLAPVVPGQLLFLLPTVGTCAPPELAPGWVVALPHVPASVWPAHCAKTTE